MVEWFQANWLWVVLGLAAVWFFFGRRGMGCAMGGHEHGSHQESDERDARKSSASGRRHGCC
jgi:hypothetical protein